MVSETPYDAGGHILFVLTMEREYGWIELVGNDWDDDKGLYSWDPVNARRLSVRMEPAWRIADTVIIDLSATTSTNVKRWK